MLAGAAMVLVGMASIAWLMAPDDELVTEDPVAGNHIAADPITTPVTSFEGYEEWPAISPDGKLAAFIAEGRHGGRRHLYVKQLSGGSQAKQLTFGDTDHRAPAWSPEGDRIVFYRWSTGDPEAEILTITPFGTDEKLVLRFPDCPPVTGGIDWSPDGRYLAFPACSEDGVPGIFLLSMDDGTQEQITFAPQEPRASREVMPKFSPAGDAVAYVRKTNNGDAVVGVYIQDIVDGKARGEPRPLETINERNMLVYDIGWVDGGDSLLWSAGDSYANTFLSVTSVASGDTRRLAAGSRARHFSVVGNLLVYMKFQDDFSIWRIGGPDAAEPGVPEPWSPSTWDDDFPVYSPSGDEVVFTSDRAGTMDVYVADVNGRNYRRLTDLPFATSPRFSQNGRHIAFGAIVDESGDRLYVIPAEGGFPVDLSSDDLGEGGRGSDNDEWIYYLSRGVYRPRGIWRVRPDGSEREQLTEVGGFYPELYGERVYFQRGGRVWSVAAGGGGEAVVLDERVPVGSWTIWNDKVVYMQRVAADETEASSASRQLAVIKVFDLETKESYEHATVSFAPGNWMARGRLTVSPDGRFILYAGREHAGSDLIKVENFR